MNSSFKLDVMKVMRLRNNDGFRIPMFIVNMPCVVVVVVVVVVVINVVVTVLLKYQVAAPLPLLPGVYNTLIVSPKRKSPCISTGQKLPGFPSDAHSRPGAAATLCQPAQRDQRWRFKSLNDHRKL